MLATSLLSLALLLLAGGLLDSHRRDWRRAQGLPAADPARRFARSRFRRRVVATAAIGVVGALIAVWPVTPREPLWVAVYTGALLGLALLIFTLGVGDAWASGAYYRAESRRALAEQAEALTQAIEGRRPAESASDTEAVGA